MRLPRRIPWSSLAELDQLCISIYADDSDVEAKIFAINRISAWKAITTLPNAIESTLAILVVIVQDQKQLYSSSLALRQSYSTAIIRLVNGLVDPLQAGTYARSIISIAQQLGLPTWLVELRHAATHEDLPSLDLLREASRQSMAWLLHNYYLPTLNPVIAHQALTPLRPLAPMLKLYKSTMKIVTRDVSLVAQYKPRIINILRDIERWISEAKVAAISSTADLEYAPTQSFDDNVDGDVKEIWALERFSDCLMEKGMLVPLSKKKRQYSSDALLPSKASIALWEPLLRHVHGIHAQFPFTLCRRLVSIILDSITSQEGENYSDPSYLMYTICWTSWAMQTWNETSPSYLDLRQDALANLVKGLRYDSATLSSQSFPFVLLRCLAPGPREFETISGLLKLQSMSARTVWSPRHLDVMQERQTLLQSYQIPTRPASQNTVSVTTNTSISREISALGWRILQEQKGWKCCPIGVYAD
ncbi:Las1-domain-containing protein [Pholiota conissans]|uniref:Las1-domain-containing protein n=1 Tax=Pholiota conissans TaxID=109636 RepID=A0A9P5YTT0_9AGAR|nr:Las1-domain-containing protein [Pholiota conissans]